MFTMRCVDFSGFHRFFRSFLYFWVLRIERNYLSAVEKRRLVLANAAGFHDEPLIPLLKIVDLMAHPTFRRFSAWIEARNRQSNECKTRWDWKQLSLFSIVDSRLLSTILIGVKNGLKSSILKLTKERLDNWNSVRQTSLKNEIEKKSMNTFEFNKLI